MPRSEVQTIYDTLFAHYGELFWWPARTPYEVIVGAILTQNTAWSNVEKAIANFAASLSPQTIERLSIPDLSEIIKPAGFFNQKARYLKAVTAWYAQYGYDVAAVRCEPLTKLRSELLATLGVGQETADSILLYAFGFTTFVVDAYTMRLCERYPLPAGSNYEAVKRYFEAKLPPSAEVYNRMHAMIVINAKDHCKKKPHCASCPLNQSCGKNGVCLPATHASPIGDEATQKLNRRLSSEAMV